MCRRYAYFSRFPARARGEFGLGIDHATVYFGNRLELASLKSAHLASAWRRVALLRVPSIKVTGPAAKVFSKLPSAVTSSGGPGAASLVADAHINLNLCLGTDANNMRGEP
jgi:hypothetical protein